MGYNSWVTRVKELSKVYNLDIFALKFNCKTKSDIRRIVTENFINAWREKLHRSDIYPILRTYSIFKFEFKIEPYLIHVSNYKYRNAMIKFRTSSHKLEIEKGRHTNPKTPIENRLCKFCGVIEDEMHFLLYCKLYETDRKVFLDSVSDRYPFFEGLSDHDKLTFLISFDESELLTHTAKFIHHSFEKRCFVNGQTLSNPSTHC